VKQLIVHQRLEEDLAANELLMLMSDLGDSEREDGEEHEGDGEGESALVEDKAPAEEETVQVSVIATRLMQSLLLLIVL
jgi:hypothetical protein